MGSSEYERAKCAYTCALTRLGWLLNIRTQPSLYYTYVYRYFVRLLLFISQLYYHFNESILELAVFGEDERRILIS